MPNIEGEAPSMVEEAAPKKRSKVRNQHHVPRMLQRPFATDGAGKAKQVHVFDKHTGKTFKAPIENVFAARDFNTYEGEATTLCLEDGMAEVENLAAPVLRKIIAERSLAGLSGDERTTLCLFAALQKVRGVALRAQMGDMSRALREMIRAQGADPERLGELRGGDSAEDLKRMALEIIRENLAEFAQSFMGKVTVLIAAAPGETFLLGDTPVTWTNKTNTGPYGNLGLEVRGIEIYLPLAPDLTLGFLCPSLLEEMQRSMEKVKANAKAYAGEALLGLGVRRERAAEAKRQAEAFIARHEPELAAIGAGTPMPSTHGNMDFLNSLQVGQSERYLVSTDGDFALPRRMIRDNEKYRRGARLKFG